MANIEPIEILQRVTVLLVAAIFTSWTWLAWRLLTGQPILPEQPLVPRRAVPWRFGTILLVFLVYVSVSLLVSINYRLIAPLLPGKPAARSPVGADVKGGDLKAKAEAPPSDGRSKERAPVVGKVGPAPPSRPAETGLKATIRRAKRLGAKEPGDEEQPPWSHLMLLNGSIMVVLLILVPRVVRMASGGDLADFGLSFDDWWPQAIHGVVATLIVAPPIYAIQFVATKIWIPVEHPLKRMIDEEFSVSVGWLAVVTAVILAPMFEELVFRGLLQSWLVALLERGSRTVRLPWQQGTASGVASENPLVTGDWDAEPELASLSVPAVSPCPDSSRSRERTWLAIALTSILFAYVHAPQWPAPIALFALAMVIGTMYHRTGSLITAVCIHATFNGISTLMLFAAVLSGEKLEPIEIPGQAPIELRRLVKTGERGVSSVMVSERRR